MTVLLSIKPEFAEKILSGEKRFEFRRVMPKRRVERVVLYSSSPIQRIVGEFRVLRVHTASPEALWRRTSASAGIRKAYFSAYFSDRPAAHAFEITEPRRYEHPIDPRVFFAAFRPPQSFMYLDSALSAELSSAA